MIHNVRPQRAYRSESGRPQGRRQRASLNQEWATKFTLKTVEGMRSLTYVIGLPLMVAMDILLGAIVLPHLFPGLTGPARIMAIYGMPIATSAIQMPLWRMAFKASGNSNVVGKIVMVLVGVLGGVFLSLIDTFIDGLTATIAFFPGANPAVFPPPEAATSLVYWVVYTLFAGFSAVGEPVVAYILYFDKGTTAKEADEEDREEEPALSPEPLP